MSGSNHTVPSAPLDLTNKTRERGSCSQGPTGDPSPPTHSSDRHKCSNGQTVHALAPRDSCNGSSSTQTADANGMGNRTTDDLGQTRPVTPNTKCNLTDTAGISKDSSFSKLPIRKRPFPLDHDPAGPRNFRDEQHNEPKRRHSPSPKTYPDRTHLNTDVQRTVNEARDHQTHMDSQSQFMPPGTTYLIAGCPYYQWAPQYTSPRKPIAIQTTLLESADRPLADIAAATHQDEDGDTPLHIAVVKENAKLVTWLIEIFRRAHKDLDIFNNLRQTPLHLAVIIGQPSLVKALLDAGADAGALDRHGQTALHLCCEHGEAECLAVILRHYAHNPSPHLEVRNYEGLTPLHLAVQNRDIKVTRILLDGGAEINAGDNKSGRSPLMHAVENDCIDMVKLLIESRCDVNAQSYSGNTALHSACGRGRIEIVRVLLKNGADNSLKNNHNDTAIMVAKNKKVSDVLRGKGTRNYTAKGLSSSTGSLSPGSSNHSPLVTPTHQSSTALSPGAPVSHLPRSQSVESISERQSPVNGNERIPRTFHNIADNRANLAMTTYPFRCFSPPGYDQINPSHIQRTLIASPPFYYASGIQKSQFYTDAPFILLPAISVPVTYGSPSLQCTVSQSRPSSQSSDQSDMSTMSINSDERGVS